MAHSYKIQLRALLEGLDDYLVREYLNMSMTYEADMEALAFHYLRKNLKKIGKGKWVVGCRHQVIENRQWMPDLTIYRADSPKRYIKNAEKCIVAIIELKYRSSLKDDLEKLKNMEADLRRKRKKNVLYWMVYGDHFNETVHASNFAAQIQRKLSMEKWQKASPSTRGCSIVKVGIGNSGTKSQQEVRRLFNKNFWDNGPKKVK